MACIHSLLQLFVEIYDMGHMWVATVPWAHFPFFGRTYKVYNSMLILRLCLPLDSYELCKF